MKGLEPPKSTKPESQPLAAGAEATEVSPQKVAVGESLSFDVSFKLPEGFKLNKLYPVSYELNAAGEQSLIAKEHLGTRKKAVKGEKTVRVQVPRQAAAGKATLELALRFGYCRDGKSGICKIKTARWKIPVEATPSAKGSAVQLEAVAAE